MCKKWLPTAMEGSKGRRSPVLISAFLRCDQSGLPVQGAPLLLCAMTAQSAAGTAPRAKSAAIRLFAADPRKATVYDHQLAVRHNLLVLVLRAHVFRFTEPASYRART